jgi:transcriptional regulator with XRE-family HTH domain
MPQAEPHATHGKFGVLGLKLWRLQQGLTQEQAARRLGIGESTLALLESGRLKATAGQLDQLRRTFGASTESLFEPVREHIEAAP